jgi:hypothetical protein
MPLWAKLFMSREISMGKAIIQLGYKSYIIDTVDAVAVTEILSRAEIYERKAHKNEGGNYDYTTHVYDQDAEQNITLVMFPDSMYRMAKLAGKPEAK